MLKLWLALLVAWLALPVPASAQDPIVVLTDGQDHYPLGLYLEYLEDPVGSLTIDDVTAVAYAGQFVRSHDRTPNFGYTNAVTWVRFRVRNDTNRQTDWYLQLGNPEMHHIDLYTPSPTAPCADPAACSFTHLQTGSYLPFATRELPSREFVFRMSFPPRTEVPVYLRFQSGSTMSLPLTLRTPESFMAQALTEYFAYGLFYGALLVMLGYNLFLFLSLRDASYLYYVLFIFSVFLYRLYADGLIYQYLWPNLGGGSAYFQPLIHAATVVSGLAFAGTFLSTKTQVPRWHRLLLILVGAWVTLVLTIPIHRSLLTLALAMALSLVSIVVLLGLTFVLWRRRYRPVRYYVWGWVGAFAGSALTILAYAGLLPNNVLTQQGAPLGIVWLVLSFSLALGDRINIFRQERDRLVIEQNVRLERMVQERTAELVRAKDDAENADRAKSTFLANMSHELRTPLNAILGFSELLRHAPNLTPTQRKNLEIVGHNGEYLLSFVNNVLDLAEIAAGKAELRLETVDLGNLLLEVGEILGVRAQRKGLALAFDLAPGVPQFIQTDPDKLRRVLINLLDNAVKFTEQGEVTLRVSLRPGERMTELPASASGSASACLHFALQSTGAGVAPEALSQVPASAVQATGSPHTGQGTDLRTPISRDFVRLMGGELAVESADGVGTVLGFDVPIGVPDVTEVPAAGQDGRPQRTVFSPGQPVPGGSSYGLPLADPAEGAGAVHRGPVADPETGAGFPSALPVPGSDAPAAWWEALQRAAIAGDVAEILALAEELSARDAVLSERLCVWADGFEYDKIGALCAERFAARSEEGGL